MRIALAVTLTLMFVVASPASAHFEDDTTGTLLARVYVSEAGWNSRDDHTAIYWAIRNRAEQRGVTFRAHLEAYARGIHASSPRAAWVRGLRADAVEGDAWPERYAWDDYRSRWRRVLVFAATDVVFPPDNPCDGPVEHWAGTLPGTEVDRTRAARAVAAGRWRRVSCGPMAKNAFFSVRRRRARQRPPEPVAVADDEPPGISERRPVVGSRACESYSRA